MRSPFVLTFLVSAAIHAGLFWPTGVTREARVAVRQGATAMAVRIVPSAASRAGRSATVAEQRPPTQVRPEAPTPPSRVEPRPQPPAPREVVEASRPEVRPRAEVVARREAVALASPMSVQPPETQAPSLDAVSHPDVPQPRVVEPPKATPVAAATPQPARQVEGEGENQVNAEQVDGDLGEEGASATAAVIGTCKPRYPLYSRVHGEEGTVVVSVEVLPDGRCGRLEIMKSSGYGRLDRAALEALRDAEFTPAMAAGRPVASTWQQTITFRLKDAE